MVRGSWDGTDLPVWRCRWFAVYSTRAIAAIAVLGSILVALSPASRAGASQAAPRSLVAAQLATAAALSTAGVPISGIEDDGGAQSPEAFSSQVQALAQDGTALKISLASYPSRSSARSAFSGIVQSAATPLVGVGDRAATSGDNTYVLKGSQVLSVTAKLSAQATQQEIQAKEHGGPIPTNLGAAATADSAAVAKALGAKLSGTAAKSSARYRELPVGAVDPCATPTATVASALHVTRVTSKPVLTDTPPAQECEYSTSAGTFDLYTVTAAQAAKAVPPTTVSAVIAHDSFASSSNGTAGSGGATSAEGPGATAQFGSTTASALVGPDTSVTLVYQAPKTVEQAAKQLGIAADTTFTNSFERTKELCRQIYNMAYEDMGTYVGYSFAGRWEHALARAQIEKLCDDALFIGPQRPGS